MCAEIRNTCGGAMAVAEKHEVLSEATCAEKLAMFQDM